MRVYADMVADLFHHGHVEFLKQARDLGGYLIVGVAGDDDAADGKRHPILKVVLEHITTEQAVEFIERSSSKIAATITPHHLHINRNAMFSGGLRSDFFCLPVAKRESHRLALRKAATSGKPCFFLGTDSAPHLRSFKESSCGCAGIFNSPYALESYAAVFEEENALDRLEAFASEYGPNFYGLPLNEQSVTLIREPNLVPDFFEVCEEGHKIEKLVPFHAGKTLAWTLVRGSTDKEMPL